MQKITHYPVQPRDKRQWGFVFVWKYEQNIGKNISKNLSGKYNQNILSMLNNLQHVHLKLIQTRVIQEKKKHLVFWLVIKLLIKVQEPQELYNKLIQKKVKMSMIKKERQKVIYDLRLI